MKIFITCFDRLVVCHLKNKSMHAMHVYNIITNKYYNLREKRIEVLEVGHNTRHKKTHIHTH